MCLCVLMSVWVSVGESVLGGGDDDAWLIHRIASMSVNRMVVGVELCLVIVVQSVGGVDWSGWG